LKNTSSISINDACKSAYPNKKLQNSDQNKLVEVVEERVLDNGDDDGNDKPKRKVTNVEKQRHLKKRINCRQRKINSFTLLIV
jgi:hypothetical protein